MFFLYRFANEGANVPVMFQKRCKVHCFSMCSCFQRAAHGQHTSVERLGEDSQQASREQHTATKRLGRDSQRAGHE